MKLYRIKKSAIDKKGRGLYATKDIKAGTKVIDYIGKLITKKQTEESDKYDNGKPIYLFTINKRYDLDGDFPWNTAGLINHSCDNNCDYDGKGTKIIDYIGKLITKKQTEESDKYNNNKPIYLFTINKRYDLDGDFPWNTAGLINHSCDNNCDYDGKGLKIWVKAIRDIKKGEEFTCDYGFGYDENYKQFPCKCDSKNCCGYIVRAESRWRINKKFAMSNKKNLIKNSR